MEPGDIVTNKSTLRRLERLGYITEPKHEFFPHVDNGEKTKLSDRFTCDGVKYKLTYYSGNFYPVLKIATFPAKRGH